MKSNETGTKNRLIKISEVVDRVGLSRRSVYNQIARGEFPRPVRLGAQSVAWPEAEIDAWVGARIAARDAEARP
ncbi:helix-turn-helix transcriptional regulator [Martelella sp. FOR1707]